MSSPASVVKHPIHPMLVVFPIGLWVFALVSEIIFRAGGAPLWQDIAFRTMAGGIIGALLAAVPGFIDYLSLSGRPRRIASYHMALNLSLVVLFAINLLLRTAGNAYILLTIIGVLGLAVAGWLGGELVYVHGVAVEPRAVAQPESDMETRFDEYWSAYNYSLNKSQEQRYEGKNWQDVEDDLRVDWDREHPGTWGRYKNTIRRGWEARH